MPLPHTTTGKIKLATQFEDNPFHAQMLQESSMSNVQAYARYADKPVFQTAANDIPAIAEA